MDAQIAKLVSNLHVLESAALADVMVAMGLSSQVLGSELFQLGPAKKFAGPALCARGAETSELPPVSTHELDALVYPGAVVVIETGRCQRGAIIGDNMVASMRKAGAVGFVVDGGVRDADELSLAEAPIVCRYKSPTSAHRFWAYRELQVPISLPGIWQDVTIRPGDLIMGDGDGIVALPLQHASIIIRYAEQHVATESRIRRAIENGTSREEATVGSNRLKHVIPVNESSHTPTE